MESVEWFLFCISSKNIPLRPHKKNKMKKFTLLILGVCLAAQVSYGQSKNFNDSVPLSLNDITIQGSRLQSPFSEQNRNITVIDRKLIEMLPVKSVNELLTYVAGVDIRQRGPFGSQADVSIDGGTFDQTLVLINGIKISDPQTGHNMMNIPIALNAIDHIEILKGAAARIYGINALNGAINIVTKRDQKTGVELNLYSGSSFQKDSSNQKLYAAYGIDATATLSGAKVNQLFSISHTQSSGYRYNTAFDNDKIYYQNDIKLGTDKSLQFLGGYVANDFGANGFYAAPADIESKENVQTALLGVNADLKINDYWVFKPRVSYRYNKDDYIFIRQKPAVYENIHETNVMDAELNNTFLSGIGNFGLGLEMRSEYINSNSLGKHNRLNYGIYGEYKFDKIQHLLVNLGAYTNYNSDFGWQVLPGIDAGYSIYKNLRLFASAGTGERLPTYTDLYYQGPSNIGNPLLKPETSFHSEIGLKYNSAKLNASASYFYRNTSNFIDWVKDSLSQPWQPQNFNKIKTKGISLYLDYRILDQQSISDFVLISTLSYTWLNPVIKQSENSSKISQYALENLRNQFVGTAHLSYLHNLSLTITGQYNERVSYKSYLLLDTKIAYTEKQIELYAEINNITNVSYIEAGAVPMVGRWVSLGVKWNWER